MKRFLVLSMMVLCLTGQVGIGLTRAAELGEAGSSDAGIGEFLRVSLVTIGPGQAAYELFGHNALVVRDTRTGRGWAFNYGVFNFEQEYFYWRFIQGRLWYEMAAFDADAMIRLYEEDDRSVWEQELALSPKQRWALFEYLRGWVGRSYLYDYYLNNCSTQVRDALDQAGVLDGAIHRAAGDAPTERSFRWQTRRLTAGDWPLYLALEVVLGSPIDRPISRWQALFLPQELRKLLGEIQIAGPDGRKIPLVQRERRIYQSTRFEMPANPPFVAGWFLLAGVLIAGVLVGLARGGRTGQSQMACECRIMNEPRPSGSGDGVKNRSLTVAARKRMSIGRLLAFARGGRKANGWRVGFVVVAMGWCLVMGLAGAVCVWGWLFTDHWATRWNLNVLLVNVLALGLVVVPPWVGRTWRGRVAAGLSSLIAVMALVGAGLSALSGGRQYNYDVMALALPVWLALAGSIWMLYRPVKELTQVPSTKTDAK